MEGLTARLIAHVSSPEGRQGDVILVEPNGDEHVVRCLLRSNSTVIGGKPEVIDYLNRRYGEPEVCFAKQGAVLGIPELHAAMVNPGLDLRSVLIKLAQHRPVFHSEADLQHALAWQIKEEHPTAKVRLERRFLTGPAMYLDLWVELDGERLAIELKYQTAALEVAVAGEQFHLRNKGAEDNLCYDFLSDVARLERLQELLPGTRCIAVLITNEPLCWQAPRSSSPRNKDAFRIHEGSCLSGKLSWRKEYVANPRGSAIELRGTYSCKWEIFSELEVPRGSFKMLLVEV